MFEYHQKTVAIVLRPLTSSFFCAMDKVLEAAKTITTIRVRMPENGTYFTKTLFLTEKYLAVILLFDLSCSKS